jgi:hypothetical protein
MQRRTTLRVAAALVASALVASPTTPVAAQERIPVSPFSSAQLAARMVQRRAIEAVIWGTPAVNYDAMYQALVRAKGDFNQIVYWSRPADWKNQTLTPNTESLYVIPFINTKVAGPVVLEIPRVDDVLIVGSITDFWQRALEDVGPAGADKGKGGKFLVLPPGYQEKVPDGYIPIASQVYQNYALLGCVPKSTRDADVAEAVAHLKQIKLYPLSQAGAPQATTFVDATNLVFDSTIPFDLRFFQALDRMVQAEPWLPWDKAMIDKLRSIGIEKGKPFKPDLWTERILRSAILEAHAWLWQRFLRSGSAYYPGRQWRDIVEPLAVKSEFTFQTPVDYDTDMRGVLYYWAFSGCKCLGDKGNEPAAQIHLITHWDKEGRFLDGAGSYHLKVPANAPVRRFWSLTAYDVATHALIRDVPWGNRSSLTPGMQKSADGSVDIYFGPRAPRGKEANWIPTKAGGSYEVIFRFYGPEPAAIDKTWQLSDIEKTETVGAGVGSRALQ